MKRLLLVVAILGFFGLSAQSKEFIIKQRSNNFYQLSSVQGMKILDHHEVGGLLKVDIKDSDVYRIVPQLYTLDSVEYIVPNFKLKAFSVPFDPYALKEQWAIKKVNAEKAWSIAGNRGSKNTIVAVIDTGVDYKHKALSPNMVNGYDYYAGDADPMDETGFQNPGHGTHCAGVIGATGVVDGGTIGISPEVSIMPIRFLGANGGGDLMNGIKAIDFAIEKGASVISASWGAQVSPSEAKPLVEAVQRADAAGVIFVAAAANDGKSNDVVNMYPTNANTPNMIAVAASNSQDQKPSWSNYGKGKVHVAAPGENIMSTLPKDKYGDLSGTSMATPLVAGLVALLKSQDRNLTGAQIRALLQVTGAKTSIEVACNCRVDAGEAMNALKAKKMFLVPSAQTLAVNEGIQLEVVNGVGPFTFTSQNESVIKVDSKGYVTAIAKGETQVTVTDSQGKTSSSLDIRVGDGSGGGGGTPDDPNNPGNPGVPTDCPFQDKFLCDLACQFQPSLPWCGK